LIQSPKFRKLGKDLITKRKEGVFLMPSVVIRDNENFERAFKRFKKACEKSGLMSDIKKHQHFEKPSERRKRKLNAARRRQRKLMALEM